RRNPDDRGAAIVPPRANVSAQVPSVGTDAGPRFRVSGNSLLFLQEISMKAVCYHGKHSVEVESVPDPVILNPRHAILKITWMAEKLYGYSASGLFGYSHMFGGYAGGQAEYVRVPFADVGPLRVPDDLTDEQVLFLSDILSTAYMAAENCQIERGDTLAIWGC